MLSASIVTFMFVKMSPREPKDLFSIAAENILQRTFFYDNLVDLKGTLPPTMVEYLQEQYFPYHRCKEDERVRKFNFSELYSLIEGGTLDEGQLYTIKRKYWLCTQLSDFELLPSEKYPQQKKRYNANYMNAYYCHTCWFDKVSAVYYQTQQRDKNVEVDVREVEDELMSTGLGCEGTAYNYLCNLCKCRVIEITESENYEYYGDEDSEEDSEEEEDEEEDFTSESPW